MHPPSHACKCLNVRISPLSHVSHLSPDDEWLSVNVDDDGIVVMHTELTLRTRSKISSDPNDASRGTRYVSLICMSCQFTVYRVLQPVHPGLESKEGLILPTDDWVEKDVLKSRSGQVEIHKDCLARDAIIRAESHPSFSTTFRILFPSEPTQSSASPLKPPQVPDDPPKHLPPLAPILLPAPFTPSHPAFLHIFSITTAESEKIRAAAEEELSRVTQQKVREIEEQEARLRRQAEVLWSQFRAALDTFDCEKRGNSPHRKQDSVKWSASPHPTSPPPTEMGANIISIRDFVPRPAMSHRWSSMSSGSHTPRTSALSASLAASSFHYPRERQHLDSSDSSDIPPQASQNRITRSLSTASSTTLPVRYNSSSSDEYIDPFVRDMNEAKDIATSLLVLNLEAQMRQRNQLSSMADNQAESSARGSSNALPYTSPKLNGGKKKQASQAPGDETANTESQLNQKGKRKVTFDTKPDIVTIKRDVTKEKDEALSQEKRGREISIFDLEDESSRDIRQEAPDTRPPEILPAIETQISQVPRTRRTTRLRQSSGAGLPQSLSSLRPHGLPAPSVGKEYIHNNIAPIPSMEDGAPPIPRSPEISHTSASETETDDDDSIPVVEEIMDLVAANVPSHRGAWRKDSKAWDLFRGKQSNRINARDDGEFDADDSSSTDQLDDQYGWNSYVPPSNIARSLSMTIGVKSRRNLGSQSLHTNGMDGPVVRHHANTSAALRRAAYAERDRSREMDPGALDFVIPQDEDDEDDESRDSIEAMVEGRGRRRALSILQSGSEIPEAGMWRSLA